MPEKPKFDPAIGDGNPEWTAQVKSTVDLTRTGGGWDSWFDGPKVSNDFMSDREQPEPTDGVN